MTLTGLIIFLVIGAVAGWIAGQIMRGGGFGLVGNIVFVLTWPVGLYAEVYQGQSSAQQWLHRQACEGGGKLGEKKAAPI